jgi:hypothetical protein
VIFFGSDYDLFPLNILQRMKNKTFIKIGILFSAQIFFISAYLVFLEYLQSVSTVPVSRNDLGAFFLCIVIGGFYLFNIFYSKSLILRLVITATYSFISLCLLIIYSFWFVCIVFDNCL